MRRIIVVLVALVALSAVWTAPVLGAEAYKFSGKQVGVSADAFWQSCEENTPVEGQTTCEFVSIFAFNGRSVFREAGTPTIRQSGFACVSLDVTDENGLPVSVETGCAEEFVFASAADLATAALTATIPVETLECTETPDGVFCEPVGSETRDVVVSAAWTAIGAPTTFRDRFVSHTESEGFECVFRQIGHGIRTEAVATATVDGAALGESRFAMLTDGTFKFLDRCR